MKPLRSYEHLLRSPFPGIGTRVGLIHGEILVVEIRTELLNHLLRVRTFFPGLMLPDTHLQKRAVMLEGSKSVVY